MSRFSSVKKVGSTSSNHNRTNSKTTGRTSTTVILNVSAVYIIEYANLQVYVVEEHPNCHLFVKLGNVFLRGCLLFDWHFPSINRSIYITIDLIV